MDDKPLEESASAPIDPFNKFMVASGSGPKGRHLVFLKPVPLRLSEPDALLLAAWLVAIIGDDELWQRTLKAVENS